MLNFLKSLSARPIFRKMVKLALLAVLVYFGVHMFNATYVVKNNNGIHGVIARKTWEVIQANATKAQTFDTIPTDYSGFTDIR